MRDWAAVSPCRASQRAFYIPEDLSVPQRDSGKFILLLGRAALVEWGALLCFCVSATCSLNVGPYLFYFSVTWKVVKYKCALDTCFPNLFALHFCE